VTAGFKPDDVLKAARELPAEDLPALIGQLETAKAVAWQRLAGKPEPMQADHDELLAVSEAARRLGISEDYLYRHAQEYPFTRRQGRKLLFSAQGIDRHIRQNKT
jgi:excisionase family DNA binding protein